MLISNQLNIKGNNNKLKKRKKLHATQVNLPNLQFGLWNQDNYIKNKSNQIIKFNFQITLHWMMK